MSGGFGLCLRPLLTMNCFQVTCALCWMIALARAQRSAWNLDSQSNDRVSLGRMSLSASTWSHRRVQDNDRLSDYDLDLSEWVATASTEQYHVQASDSRATAMASLRTRVRTRPLPQKVVEQEEEVEGPPAEILHGATQPLVKDAIWEQLTGEEFYTPSMIEAMTRTGLYMAENHKTNKWVEWKAVDKITEQAEQGGSEIEVLERGDILVWCGKCKKEGHGSNVPMIKTKSVINMSPKDMAELLLDSSRVKTYNKISLGRKDAKVMQKGVDTHGPMGHGETKIVRNLTQPPVAKKKMLATTMMHGRPLRPTDGIMDGGYVVVSRAVPNLAEETQAYMKSEILLGVNVLRNMADPNTCRVTAVTHVYAPSLPTMLASRLGVKSAINFVKDVRSSCGGCKEGVVATN